MLPHSRLHLCAGIAKKMGLRKSTGLPVEPKLSAWRKSSLTDQQSRVEL